MVRDGPQIAENGDWVMNLTGPMHHIALEAGSARESDPLQVVRPSFSRRGLHLSARYLPISKSSELRNAKILHIISSALNVLSREGHARLSMRSVATEAQLSLSTLQHYFESKEKLLMETVRVFAYSFMDRYKAFSLQKELTAREALDHVLQEIIDEATHKEIAGILIEIWALGVHDQAIGELLTELYGEYRRLLAKLFMDLDIGLSPKAADDLASLLAMQSEGLVMMAFYGGILHPLPESLSYQFKTMWTILARQMVTDAPIPG